MNEVRVAAFVFIGFWVLLTVGILGLGQRVERLRAFRACMLREWKPALGIAVLFLAGNGFGGRGVLNPYGLAIFGMALVGLGLARSIGYEAPPLVESFKRRQDRLRTVLVTLLIALFAGAAAVVTGSVGMSIMQQIFHETVDNSSAMTGFAANAWQAFWLFLAGAGIAEETMYRLVIILFLWRVIGRKGWAVALAALLFGLYHLTPLDGMYRTFLQFPISQVLSSMLIGLVYGLVFLRRGFECVVLAHALSNMLPFLFFQ